MINVNLRIRHAIDLDYDRIANLIYHASNSHRHLDWHSPLEWVGSSNYWVREDDGHITATLACPEDPPHVAWIRFFGHQQVLTASEAWFSLWEAARSEIAAKSSRTNVAAIVVKQWFQSLLLSSGFEPKQDIVLLEWAHENFRPFPMPHGIRIRPMRAEDMSTVAEVDLAAFGQFWHNTENVLQKARQQCASATVAEDDSGQIIGYQLSTKNPLGAHLARLGVRPEVQGRGVGAALVSQLIQDFNTGRSGRISVNTQADNTASLALYRKMGFGRTGEHFPVLVYSTGV